MWEIVCARCRQGLKNLGWQGRSARVSSEWWNGDLATAAEDDEPEEREDDGPDDADGNERRPRCGGARNESAAVLLRVEWVVGDRNALILGDGDGGLELARVQAAVGVVVEGDAELLGRLEAEGKRAETGRLVSAGSDGSFRGDPCGCAGHWETSEERMREMPAVVSAALVSAMELGRL